MRWGGALPAALLVFSAASAAASLEGPGFSIDVPQGWELRRNAGEAPVMLRPPADAKGWGDTLVAVDSQKLGDTASCLDGQFQRRLRALEKRATDFEDSEEQRLKLGGQPAFETVLRYRRGPREFSAYLLMVQGKGRIASVLVTAEPSAFELHRVELRALVESLRARPYQGPDYVPPRGS